MLLSCHSVLFGGYAVETALQHMAWAGYRGVELAMIPGMAEHISASPIDVARVREGIAAHGLHLVALDVATHEPDRLHAALGVAAELNVPYVAITSGGRLGDPASRREANHQLRASAKAAEDIGVTLALTPRVGSAVHNLESARATLEAVASPALRLCLDPSHLYRGGDDPVAAAKQLGAQTVLCHVRDYAATGDRPSHGPGAPETQVPGRGSLDLPGFIGALGDTGFGGAIAVHIVGTVRRGKPDPVYPLSRVAGLAGEAAGYLRRSSE